MKFTALKKHLQTEGAQPIYLFFGEEYYFREKGVALLKENCVSQPELNYTVFDGAALKGEKIKALTDALCVFPFLSEKRAVLVNEFYPTEKEYNTYLKPFFENPVTTTVLILVNAGMGKAKAGVCDFKKKPNVTLVDCARADEESIAKWIYLTFKQAGIYADGNVCNTILRYCVCDMARVSKEVEKLKDYVKDKVTLEDVNALVYPDNEYKMFELTQAAARKDYTAFIRIMDGMVGKGFDENAFLNALCAHFRTLYEVACFKGSNAQAAQVLDMKEYAVKKSREQAVRFSVDALKEYYADVYEASARARAGEITFSAALKTVINKIFFKNY